MLVIRFQRTGRSKVPTYRLVVAEKARPVKSKFLEIIGHFMPTRTPVVLEVERDRLTHWISKGAAPSNTAARQLKRAGVEGMDPFIVRYSKRPSKKAPVEAPAAAVSAAPAAAAPAPSEPAAA